MSTNILLLTNRDSDNTGDQVIELCDIALIHAVMKNLGIAKKDYKITSRAAGFITQQYLSTRNPELLKGPEEQIKKSDIVIFGGAPLFNYKYQNFYERTAITVDFAQKYQKPVIFSAIGIEHYDEKNAKCQRLKKSLNQDCVRQITTRDGMDLLEKFRENPDIKIGKVSDPALYASKVFENFKTEKNGNKKKKIGLFILRATGFTNNNVKFSQEQAANLWVDLVHDLKEKGYDYELITNGHFGDEAFMDHLVRKYGIDEKKCVFNVNDPETLIGHLTSYDGVVTCRLHPSIISFSFKIPSVGLVWNPKVKGFYESVGYEDRMIYTEGISAKLVLEKLEQAMEEGVAHDKEYLISVYQTLFDAMKGILKPEGDQTESYTYEELLENLVPFEGTSEVEKQEKLKRKFRRIYKKYNTLTLWNRIYRVAKKMVKLGIALLLLILLCFGVYKFTHGSVPEECELVPEIVMENGDTNELSEETDPVVDLENEDPEELRDSEI